MNYLAFFLGPQLLGVALVALGIFQRLYPPRKINNFYGYHTDSAQRNQQTWDEANRYSATMCIITGIIEFIVSMTITALVVKYIQSSRMQYAITYITFFLGAAVPGVAILLLTERRLVKLFGEE